MTKRPIPAERVRPRLEGPRVGYLRISVTDRCNQRCVYCMPEDGVPLREHADVLRFEEIERIVRAAVPLGVRSVRLTGGEPLVRRGITDLAGALAAVPGVEDLAITTNGVLLAPMAKPLKAAGIRRVNLSLDTLDEAKYRAITRTGAFAEARAGLEAALEAGFSPVKVNTVVVRGVNDDEIEDMALAAARPETLGGPVAWRFIELMPLGEGGVFGEEALVPAAEIVARLAELARREGLAFGPAEPEAGGASGASATSAGSGASATSAGSGASATSAGSGASATSAAAGASASDASAAPSAPGARGLAPFGAGPARYYRFGEGTVGIISPMTHGFCSTCNRLRLTSDGRIHPCLTSPLEVDVTGPLRRGASDAELTALLAEAMTLKPKAHRMRERLPELAERRMSRIGG